MGPTLSGHKQNQAAYNSYFSLRFLRSHLKKRIWRTFDQNKTEPGKKLQSDIEIATNILRSTSFLSASGTMKRWCRPGYPPLLRHVMCFYYANLWCDKEGRWIGFILVYGVSFAAGYEKKIHTFHWQNRCKIQGPNVTKTQRYRKESYLFAACNETPDKEIQITCLALTLWFLRKVKTHLLLKRK